LPKERWNWVFQVPTWGYNLKRCGQVAEGRNGPRKGFSEEGKCKKSGGADYPIDSKQKGRGKRERKKGEVGQPSRSGD